MSGAPDCTCLQLLDGKHAWGCPQWHAVPAVAASDAVLPDLRHTLIEELHEELVALRAEMAALRQERDGLAAPPDELAWLIVHRDHKTSLPKYLGVGSWASREHWWSDSANDALRFARKEDADSVIRCFCAAVLFVKAEEHMWTDAARASVDRPEPE